MSWYAHALSLSDEVPEHNSEIGAQRQPRARTIGHTLGSSRSSMFSELSEPNNNQTMSQADSDSKSESQLPPTRLEKGKAEMVAYNMIQFDLK